MPSLYLINPKNTNGGYSMPDSIHAGWVMSPDLAIVTVAAMAPSGWDVRVTEEEISPVDLDSQADFIGLTGKTAQLRRMIELSREFRKRGKTVLIGGPFASLDPETVRPHADILVTGEMEELAPRLFADLASGNWQDHYEGGRADIRLSPVPRWDLYPVHRAEMGALQTTRGCPFDCEFCDVIQYQGRKQRHKDVSQVIAELDALYANGFRNVFLCDDNFTVHRQFARTMLDALTEWNVRHADDPVRFGTQASLDIAREPDLLERCAAAGLRTVFVGIETINEASLRETGKRQNLLLPMREAVTRIVQHGIAIRAGIIVGFDHDGPDIFAQLLEFFQAAPLPDLSIGALNASKSTPLYARLRKEGRLLEGIWDEHVTSNIVPALMSREQLLDGVRELVAAAYAVPAYEQRMTNFIDCYGDDPSALVRKAGTHGERARLMMGVLRKISARGAAEAKMLSNVLAAANRKPATFPAVIAYLAYYEKARIYLDYMEGSLQRVA